MIRVMIVDDQQMIRRGLRLILEGEQGFTVVGEAGDGAEAIAVAERARPDVILMDIRMPGVDGIEACGRIRSNGGASGGAPHVLMLTTFDTDDYVYSALQAGASGFLLKDAPVEQLIAAIEAVARGDAVLAPQVTRLLVDEVAERRASLVQDPPWKHELTEREAEVLALMARGMSNAEIAGELILGEATVKTHVGRVFSKLRVRDRVGAVVAAYESGMVDPRDQPGG